MFVAADATGTMMSALSIVMLIYAFSNLLVSEFQFAGDALGGSESAEGI
jgi:hypothetical protein